MRKTAPCCKKVNLRTDRAGNAARHQFISSDMVAGDLRRILGLVVWAI